jgi:hypothetical protein
VHSLQFQLTQATKKTTAKTRTMSNDDDDILLISPPRKTCRLSTNPVVDNIIFLFCTSDPAYLVNIKKLWFFGKSAQFGNYARGRSRATRLEAITHAVVIFILVDKGGYNTKVPSGQVWSRRDVRRRSRSSSCGRWAYIG